MARRKARELAFRALFQAELGGQPVGDVWQQVRSDIADDLGEDEAAYGDVLDAEGLGFAGRLVQAYAEHSEAVDTELEEVLEGWTFRQMDSSVSSQSESAVCGQSIRPLISRLQ